MIPILPIILAIIIGPSYLFLRVEPGYLFGLDVYDPYLSPFLALCLSFLPALLGELLIRRLRVRVASSDGDSDGRRGTGRLMSLYRMSVVLCYLIAVYFLHWPRVIENLGITGWVFLDKIVVLLPFGISLLMSWLTTYRIQRVYGHSKDGFLRFLIFQLRMTALPLLPLGFVVILVDVVENIEPLRVLFEQFQYLVWLAVLVFLVLIFLLMPLALRCIWTVKPLPEGPLRDELSAFSKKLGFGCRGILVWETQGDLINAAIIGLIGPLRYVLLTDGLIRHLEMDEIRAVFAHEVGHAKKRHIFYYFIFSISFIFLFLSLEEHFMPGGSASPWHLSLYLLFWMMIFVLYWGLLLGYISRRFECQADLYGAGAVEDHTVFVNALEKISALTGNVRTKRSWRHFSVAHRVAFLKDYFQDGSTRRRFKAGLIWMMTGFWILTLATVILGVVDIRRQHIFGLAQRQYLARDLGKAELHCLEAIEVNANDVRYWQLLGNVLEDQSRFSEALEAYRSALLRVRIWEDDRRRSLEKVIRKLEKTLG